MNLRDRVIIITGGARGIGEGIAKRIIEQDARVAIADLDLGAARDTAERLSTSGPGTAIGMIMDATVEQAVNNGVAQVVDKWDGVDVLVSHAGIQIVHKIEHFPLEDWKKLLSIHLDGAFLTTKACIPHMYKKGAGSIIYRGSVHSKEASPLTSAYVTAKHGLPGFARVMSKEGAEPGVRANIICPDLVKTPVVEKQIAERSAELCISEAEVVNEIMLGETVDKEYTALEDVAEVAVLFAPIPTNALTGQSLVVSHGRIME